MYPSRRLALHALLAASASPALAQPAWPVKPIRLVLPFGPGSASDVLGRTIAEPLSRALLDGLAMGLGFLVALLLLGATRELIGQGSLGVDLHLLFGMVCCLAELQQALPGTFRTQRPLRLVLDRRPFI